MPAPKYRSRTFRRVFRKTPGGSTVMHYRRRKPAKVQCGTCGTALQGTPSATPRKLRAIPKSARRPERPFGGHLCSRCSRRMMIARVRA